MYFYAMIDSSVAVLNISGGGGISLVAVYCVSGNRVCSLCDMAMQLRLRIRRCIGRREWRQHAQRYCQWRSLKCSIGRKVVVSFLDHFIFRHFGLSNSAKSDGVCTELLGAHVDFIIESKGLIVG